MITLDAYLSLKETAAEVLRLQAEKLSLMGEWETVPDIIAEIATLAKQEVKAIPAPEPVADAAEKHDGQDLTPCHFCGKSIVFAVDQKFDKTVMLEPAAMHGGQFRINNGKALWWGKRGAVWRRHECPKLIKNIRAVT